MRLPIESSHKTAFGEKMQSATEREYNTALAHAPHARPRHIDGGPRSMTVEHSDRGTLVASKTIIYSRGKKSQEMYMVNADYLPGGSMSRSAKFPEGKKMTVDEVAEVVGPEFKEMNEDPPESVKKVRKEMEEAMSADLLPVERAAAGRLQGEDLYDALKKIVDEKQYAKVNGQVVDLFSASGMVQVADALNEKNRARFLSMPIEKMHSMTFKMLKSGSEQQAEKLEAEAEAYEAQADADRQKADAARMKESAGGLYGYTKGTQRDVEATIRKAQRQASKLAKALHGQDHQAMDFLRVHAKRAGSKTARLLLALMEEYPQTDLLPVEQVKQAEDTPMGMYGYPSGTARLALDACSALRSGIGEVAYNLHSRRMAKHDRIMGFLKEHSKTAKCGYARLLLDTYPEAPRLAAKKKLPDELKKHQFTKDDPDNPNPKGNDKDGDGKSGEKPDFLKEIEDKKGKKAMLRKAFVPDSVDGWLEWAEGSRTAAPIDDLFEMKDVRYPPEVGFIVDLLVNMGFGKGYGSPDAVLRWVEDGKSVPETIADITKHWRKQFKSTNPKVQAAFLKAMASIEDNAAPAKEYPPPRRRRRRAGITPPVEHKDGSRTAASKTAAWKVTVYHRSDDSAYREVEDLAEAYNGKVGWSGNDGGRLDESLIRFSDEDDSLDFVDAAARRGLQVTKSFRRAAVRTAMTPYEKNQKAMLAEAGDSLKGMYDPAKLAQAIVKMRSFKKMVGSSVDMVKDALIALEEGGAIRRLDDDLFFQMRDEAERLMFPQRRASTRRRG